MSRTGSTCGRPRRGCSACSILSLVVASSLLTQCILSACRCAHHSQLLGKDWNTYVNCLSVQLGRSKLAAGSQIQDAAGEAAFATTLANAMAASAQPVVAVPSSPLSPADAASAAALAAASAVPPALISLGNDHTISRAHISISWNAAAHQWEARVLGKNGFWLERVKYGLQGPVAPGVPAPPPPAKGEKVPPSPPVVLPAHKASLLRIGLGEEATCFYFVPALDPAACASGGGAGAAMPASSAATSGPADQSQPKVKKRRKSANGSGGGEDAGGAAPTSGDKPKKRRKSAAASTSADAQSAQGGFAVGAPPPLSSRFDSDDFKPLSSLLPAAGVVKMP